jgi:hypothetical protein
MNVKQKIVHLKYLFYINVRTFVQQLRISIFQAKPIVSYLDCNFTKNNTPSMPLYDAHLEGFFFYSHE